MELNFDKADYMQKADGLWLMLRVDSRQRLPMFNFVSKSREKDKKYIATLKEKRNKRSLDANAYAWVLIDKIADVMRISKEEVYRHAVRNIGGVSDTVCVQNAAVDKLRQGWEQKGLGWQTDILPSKIDGCSNVVLYYGSSIYDSKQMSDFIRLIVEDCKQLGIETLSPEELAKLEDEWR